MYVCLKDPNRKLFINKSYKHGVLKLVFSKDTPHHEIKDEAVVEFLLKSFPLFLEKKDEIPSEEEKVAEPAPAPVEEKVEEPEPEVEPIVSAALEKKEEVTTPSQILSDLLKKKSEE